jgi:hypothetical protein
MRQTCVEVSWEIGFKNLSVTEFEYVYSLNAGFFLILIQVCFLHVGKTSRRNQYSRYIVFLIIQNTTGMICLKIIIITGYIYT